MFLLTSSDRQTDTFQGRHTIRHTDKLSDLQKKTDKEDTAKKEKKKKTDKNKRHTDRQNKGRQTDGRTDGRV